MHVQVDLSLSGRTRAVVHVEWGPTRCEVQLSRNVAGRSGPPIPSREGHWLATLVFFFSTGLAHVMCRPGSRRPEELPECLMSETAGRPGRAPARGPSVVDRALRMHACGQSTRARAS